MSTMPTTTTASDTSAVSPPPATSVATPAAKPAAAMATHAPTAVPHISAPVATGCCQDASANKAAAVHDHAEKSAPATAGQTHGCHGTSEALKSLANDLKSTDAAQRLTAAQALGQLKNRAAAAPLIAALSDSDADVAYAAAEGLGILGDASAVEPLIAVLNNADGYFHSHVRTACTVSLGQLHDLRAVAPLRNAINDPMADTSAQAIRAMAALGDERGVAPLLEVVRNADGFFVQTARYAAILGLAKLGGTQADCELRFVASNEFEEAPIRNAAIGALSGAIAGAGAN